MSSVSGKWAASLCGPKGYPDLTLATDGDNLVLTAGKMPSYLRTALFDSKDAAEAALASCMQQVSTAYARNQRFWRYP